MTKESWKLRFCLSESIQRDVGMMVSCPITINGWVKVVVLHCILPNLFELCPRVLLLRRYEVILSSPLCFSAFCIFLNKNNTKEHYCNTFKKLSERKMDPKRNVHTLKGTMTLTDYKKNYKSQLYKCLYRSILVDSGSIPGHHLLLLSVIIICCDLSLLLLLLSIIFYLVIMYSSHRCSCSNY